jgi:hypothetical protein
MIAAFRVTVGGCTLAGGCTATCGSSTTRAWTFGDWVPKYPAFFVGYLR